MANAPYGEYIFEVVDYVPYGYFIWNNGTENEKGIAIHEEN